MSWRSEAACRHDADPSRWFSGYPEAIALARATCFGCPVRPDCLCSQLSYEKQVGYVTDGMFGGRTPHERRVILRHREHVG